MDSERAALLRAICEAPDDDAPRLIYADWLDEHGEAERAEFIRLQVKANELGGCTHKWSPGTTCDGCRTRKRSNELLRSHLADWTPPQLLETHTDLEKVLQRRQQLRGAPCEWHRGFVHSITCAWADCAAHLDAIIAEHPVQEASLTTWPDYRPSGMFGFDSDEMRLVGRSAWHKMPFELAQVEHLTVEFLLAAEWPRIKFTLPNRIWTGNHGNYSNAVIASR